ncbi:MAG: dual specificity protein phosphatase family protein [Rhodomicrobium sp.]|nr:dual specificity protein phosphatase family protein [Rhodomicrobium sp.]
MTENAPPWLSRRIDRLFDYFDLVFVDHGVFRAIYPNRHRLSPRAWRSSQPAPRDIRYLARKGVKTIVNLRGDRDCGSYRIEERNCRRYGIRLVNFSVKSRQLPSPGTFHDAKALFDSVEYPILLHCKSGADRVGLMSALFMILKEGLPVEQAKRQLSLRYGHIRQADTGVLDLVFESYLAHSSREPIAFLDWVDRHYDEKAILKQFHANSWANVLVNRLMKRE